MPEIQIAAATPAADWGNAIRMLQSIYCCPTKAKATWFEIRAAIDWLRRYAATPAAIDESTIAAIVGDASNGRAAATVNKIVTHCRIVCNKLARKGWLPANPFALDSFRLRAPKPKTKRHQSLRELLAIIDRADMEASAANQTDRDRWLAERRRVLVYALALTGCRKNEALYLRVQDVDLVRGVLWIESEHHRLKTVGSNKPVPIPDELRSIIERWIPQTGGVWLFPQYRNRSAPWTGGDVATRPLGQIKALAARAGVDGVTLKSLRHSWVTHGRQVWGFTAEQTQRILRHELPETQAHYEHDDLDNLRMLGAKIRLRIAPETAAKLTAAG